MSNATEFGFFYFSHLSALRNYITQMFNLSEDELADLNIRDDNTVRFSIVSSDAQQKADNISDAVRQLCFAKMELMF